jgi:hypothetical protein
MRELTVDPEARLAHVGPGCRLADVDQALAPIRALGDPVVDLLVTQPYTQVQSYLDDTEPKGLHLYWKTEFLAGLDDRLLAELRELFATCPIPEADPFRRWIRDAWRRLRPFSTGATYVNFQTADEGDDRVRNVRP